MTFHALPSLLLDARLVGALVVLAAQLDRSHHAFEAEFLNPRGREVKVFKAPTDLFAGHRLLPNFFIAVRMASVPSIELSKPRL